MRDNASEPMRPAAHDRNALKTQRRLRRLLSLPDAELSHTQRDLPSNGADVNYVRHHRLSQEALGLSWNVVEKSIRKHLLYRSREARFYRYYEMLEACRIIRYPPLLGVVETPGKTLIYSQYIDGKKPSRAKMVAIAAAGIAELEAVSIRHLSRSSPSQSLDYWLMDFFRWPYMRHTRMNYRHHLGNLDLLDSPVASLDYRRRLSALRPWLGELANAARRGPRCISHLDYAAKNMLVMEDRLHLIDWSEVKVGRIGFDGGEYLSKLFVLMDMNRFVSLRERFEQEYARAYTDKSRLPLARRNLSYLFTTLALWRCLQPQVVRAAIDSGKQDGLLEKFDYLLDEPARGRCFDAERAASSQADASGPLAENGDSAGHTTSTAHSRPIGCAAPLRN